MIVKEKTGNAVTATMKYKVAHSDKLGRYLQATKDLSAGEVILREKSIAVGPMSCSNDCLCFACLRLLPKIKKEAQHFCTKCNTAPICSAACEENSKYHTPDECELFRRHESLLRENRTEVIGILLPLRLWLLKQRDPEAWKKVDSMEAHLDKRRNSAVWKDREINVVNVIGALRLVPEGESFDPEFLQHLCGILDVNSFELRSPGDLESLILRGLYAEASLMAHDCRGNTHLTVDENFQLTIYASMPIREGEAVLFNYTSSLLGTPDRREHLREGKYFECDCSLCKDPYEMQSHMSTILCPRCREGFVGMQNPLTKYPYEKGCDWQCDKCRRTFGGRLIRATLNISRTLIDDTDNSDIKGLELLLKKLSRSLHQNHFLMLSLKQKLLAAYRKEVASPNPPRKIMQRMYDMCKEMYNVLEILEPGISRLKGIVLYEMHLPFVLLANRGYAARDISTEELALRLEEAGSLLRKALTMLLLEPVTTPEGRLAKRALQELKALNQNIADVKTMTVTAAENTRAHHKKKSHKN